MRLLVVTAVPVERDAVAGALRAAGVAVDAVGAADAVDAGPSGCADVRVDVLAAGVGPGAAGAGAGAALAGAAVVGEPYDAVVSAGIGGGFAPQAPVGSLVVARAIVAADLGAETPDGFLTAEQLGFGLTVHRPPADAAERLAKALNALYAPVLTVSTVTGTATRAAELTDRHPDAGAEAMEGFGVAEAAAAAGVPVFEVRAVSNTVGPRDRSAWRIGEALGALGAAFPLLVQTLVRTPAPTLVQAPAETPAEAPAPGARTEEVRPPC
jgi:futalosine hydrolase